MSRPSPQAIRSLDGDVRIRCRQVPPRVFRGNLASWRPPSFRQKMSPNRMAEVAQWEHDTLFPKYHLPSGISLVESYGSIKLMDYESLLFVAKQHGPRQPDKSLLPQPTALRLLGTEMLRPAGEASAGVCGAEATATIRQAGPRTRRCGG